MCLKTLPGTGERFLGFSALLQWLLLSMGPLSSWSKSGNRNQTSMQEVMLRQSNRKITFYSDKHYHSHVETLYLTDFHSTELSSFLSFITFGLQFNSLACISFGNNVPPFQKGSPTLLPYTLNSNQSSTHRLNLKYTLKLNMTKVCSVNRKMSWIQHQWHPHNRTIPWVTKYSN